MVMEQMSKENQFNTVSRLLLHFMIFTFVLNTASDPFMLVQKGTVYVLAKEIPLCPVKVQGPTSSVDVGVKPEQTISTRYRMHLFHLMLFSLCMKDTVS